MAHPVHQDDFGKTIDSTITRDAAKADPSWTEAQTPNHFGFDIVFVGNREFDRGHFSVGCKGKLKKQCQQTLQSVQFSQFSSVQFS